MSEERDFFYNDRKTKNIVLKYEDMKRNKSSFFFDVHEFEEIIDHYMNVGKPQNALEVSRLSITQHPASQSLKLYYARAIAYTGNPKEALRIIHEIEKIENTNYEVFLTKGYAYIILENFDAATDNFDKAISLSYDDLNDVLFDIVKLLVSQLKYEQAEKYLEQLYELDSDNDQVVFDLASCYNNLEKSKKSIELYKTYLENNPLSDAVWFNLGVLYLQEEEYEQAIEAFDFSLAITDQFASTLYFKGIAHLNIKQYKEAIDTFTEYIELDDPNEEIYSFIGECHERLFNYTDALKYYKKAIEINSDFAEAWYGMGIVKKETGKENEAIEHIKRAIELDNTNGEFWYVLAQTYISIGQHKDALNSYKKAFNLDPYDFDSWLDYSEILFNSNKIDEAISILKESYQYNYDVSVISYRIAAYFFEKKDTGSACKYFERGLILNYNEHKELFRILPETINNQQIQELLIKYK